MIYILAYLVCGVCSFYLLKSFLHRITEDQGGFLHCVYEMFESLDEAERQEKGFARESWKERSDEDTLRLIFRGYFVMNLIIWPIVLVALLYWMYTGATWDDLIYEREEKTSE